MKLFVHSTTQDRMKYRVWTHLQALSHKGPQMRPIGIDPLQKTELQELDNVDKKSDLYTAFTSKVRVNKITSKSIQNT